MAHTVTVGELLDGHAGLDIESLDRIYLNGYVPSLQTGAGVVWFLQQHLGYPIPSPALFGKLGTSFRSAVKVFAEQHQVPVIDFTRREAKEHRMIDVMRPHLDAVAATGRSGVAAIARTQEVQNVFDASERKSPGGARWFSYYKADRRVSCYYFYVWDTEFGAGFIKICTYFPYPMKIWLNGHEWAKRQATAAGVGFSELSNGFASCDDPAGVLDLLCKGWPTSRRANWSDWRKGTQL